MERTPWNWRVSSLCRRSLRPAKRLPPPVRTMFPSSCSRRSGSQAFKEALISAGNVFGMLGLEA